MSDFKREERFIVIKRKNLHDYTESDLRSWLRSNDSKTVECVVVESDWPEYEAVWAMIEGRTATTDYAGLEQECKELRDENAAHLEHIGELGAAGFFERVGALDNLIAERDAALKQVEGLRALLREVSELRAELTPWVPDLPDRIDDALSAKPSEPKP